MTIFYTKNSNCGVYFMMKRKFLVMGSCALLALIALFVILSRDGRQRATQGTGSGLVISPDGTIPVPRNDHVTIVAEFPKPATNASPKTMPPGKG